MAIVTLRLSEVKSKPAGRPESCRYCSSTILQAWGRVTKPVRDPQLREVVVRRYRCVACGRTFRHYPEGVGAADQSGRLVQLAALCWVLGLSLRAVSAVVGAFAVPLAHMTVWRDVQQLASPARSRPPRRVRVLGVDGFYGRLAGQRCGMVLAVDLGRGRPVAIARVDERDPAAVVAWLAPLVAALGVEVLVTDDLASLGVAAARLGCRRQVCRFHQRRWVGRALAKLGRELGSEWQAALDEVAQWVAQPPPDGPQRLFALWQQIAAPRGARTQAETALYRLREVVVQLMDHWPDYVRYQHEADVPSTNNGSERAIGRWRSRARRVRGFKSWAGLEAAFLLCNSPLP
jgi:transposase-like protein